MKTKKKWYKTMIDKREKKQSKYLKVTLENDRGS